MISAPSSSEGGGGLSCRRAISRTGDAGWGKFCRSEARLARVTPPMPTPVLPFSRRPPLPALRLCHPPSVHSTPFATLRRLASPHHHAPSGREVDGALSRPSPKRNGAPNTVPDYCAFPGHSLSAREGSVRVVTPWNTRTPAPSPSLGSITSATTGRRPGLHRLGRETPDWHPCLSGQGGPPQGPQELRLAAFLPM